MKQGYRRNSSGQTTVEAPVVLYVLLFLFFFPLINLTTVFIRMTILYYANHNACQLAARGRSFSTSINGDPTAMQLAQAGCNNVIAAYTGVHVSQLDTLIVVTNIATLAQTATDTPLAIPADVSINTYQIQVKTVGMADPIFAIPLPLSVPGLNAPLKVAFAEQQYFENPTGLIY